MIILAVVVINAIGHYNGAHVGQYKAIVQRITTSCILEDDEPNGYARRNKPSQMASCQFRNIGRNVGLFFQPLLYLLLISWLFPVLEGSFDRRGRPYFLFVTNRPRQGGGLSNDFGKSFPEPFCAGIEIRINNVNLTRCL